MRKFSKTLVAVSVIASGLSVANVASAEVEVSASAAVANMYLWRGIDLSNGSPAISGDINVSASGAYAGIWGSSGDDSNGQEYDLYIGYANEVGGFSYDVSLWNYMYPSHPDGERDTFGELSELIIGLGYGPVTFTYYDNIAGGAYLDSAGDLVTGTGEEYYTLGVEVSKYSALIGFYDIEADSSDYVHLDLGYAYNDNLSFTLSQVVAVEDDDVNPVDTDLKFVVSYSLPLKF